MSYFNTHGRPERAIGAGPQTYIRSIKDGGVDQYAAFDFLRNLRNGPYFVNPHEKHSDQLSYVQPDTLIKAVRDLLEGNYAQESGFRETALVIVNGTQTALGGIIWTHQNPEQPNLHTGALILNPIMLSRHDFYPISQIFNLIDALVNTLPSMQETQVITLELPPGYHELLPSSEQEDDWRKYFQSDDQNPDKTNILEIEVKK